MDDGSFSLITTSELFDMMLAKTSELLVLDKSGNDELFEKKKEEIQLIQKVLVLRRALFPPGTSVNFDIPPNMNRTTRDINSAKIMAKLLSELNNLKEAVRQNDIAKVEEISVRKAHLLKELKELMGKDGS